MTSFEVSFLEQINVICSGLRKLRQSQLLTLAECAEMYQACERHFNDARLARISGKPGDLLEKCVKDTQFFYILTQMMVEASLSLGDRQRSDIMKVHNWYLANKHNLYASPRFGKHRQQEEALKVLHAVASALPPYLEERLPPSESNAQIARTSNSRHQNATPIGHPVAVATAPLPRRKMVHPIVSLVNPHAQNSSSSSGLARIPTPREQKEQSDMITADRQLRLNQWEDFKSRVSYGQATLGKLQYCGRTGTPYDVRYVAHDNAEHPEYFTRQILNQYLLQQAMLKYSKHGKQTIEPMSDGESQCDSDGSWEEERAVSATQLEDFYEQTERQFATSPVRYPALEKRVSTGHKHVQNSPNNNGSGTACVSGAVQLNSVVDGIDTVSCDMQYYRQKVAQFPSPGFMLPTVSTDEFRPQTAPVYGARYQKKRRQRIQHLTSAMSAVTPPTSPPSERDRVSRPTSRLQVIDWRPSAEPLVTAGNRWTDDGYASFCFVKKIVPRAEFPSRSGRRPKSSPIRNKDRVLSVPDEFEAPATAATHHTRFLSDDVLRELMNVQRLGGTSDEYIYTYDTRYIPRSAYAHFYMPYDEPPITTVPPSMEFMTICGPKQVADSKPEKRNSSKEAHDKATGRHRQAPPRVPPQTPLPAPSVLEEEDEVAEQIEQNHLALHTSEVCESDHAIHLPQSASEYSLVTGTSGSVDPYERDVCQTESDISINIAEAQYQEPQNSTPEACLTPLPEVAESSSQSEVENTHEHDYTQHEHGQWIIEGEGVDCVHPAGEDVDVNEARIGQTSDVTASAGTFVHITAMNRDGKREIFSHNNQLASKAFVGVVPNFTRHDVSDARNNTSRYGAGHHLHDSGGDADDYGAAFAASDKVARAKLADSSAAERKLGSFPPGRVLKERLAMPRRTSPSIPSPFHGYGARSPGQLQQAYQDELEHHARLETSPRPFLDKIVPRQRSCGRQGRSRDVNAEVTMLNVSGRSLDKVPFVATDIQDGGRPPSAFLHQFFPARPSMGRNVRGRGQSRRPISAPTPDWLL